MELDPEEEISSEDNVTVGCNNNVNGSKLHFWSRSQHPWNSGYADTFIGDPSGLRIQ
jgi:hypothetical protein